jgi:putative glutamine amidotransferase
MPSLARPLVGLNADFAPAGKLQPARFRLHAGYADALLGVGALPLVVPPVFNDLEPDAYLDRLDGFLLTGGADLDPRRHGLPWHSAVQLLPPRRDDSDRQLVNRLIERRIPILAVGLGLQQLNVALGGTLYMHLPEDLPRSLPHRDPAGQTHRHMVLLEPGTRLEEIYGGIEVRVNSAHHQAVRQLGKGMRIAARSPDGVIEAIEATCPDWFCVGVQWHPEADTSSALDLQLFECFAQACLRQAQSLQEAA